MIPETLKRGISPQCMSSAFQSSKTGWLYRGCWSPEARIAVGGGPRGAMRSPTCNVGRFGCLRWQWTHQHRRFFSLAALRSREKVKEALPALGLSLRASLPLR